MIVGTMWVMKGRCFDVTLSCMCIVLAPFRENFGRLHSTQPSRVIMTPRKQPTGRSEGTPQWTTATAARLDRIASDLHRQIELVDANTGAQDVREPPEPGVAGAGTTHAWMHGCMVVHQTCNSAAGQAGRLQAHPAHHQGLSPPPSL